MGEPFVTGSSQSIMIRSLDTVVVGAAGATGSIAHSSENYGENAL